MKTVRAELLGMLPRLQRFARALCGSTVPAEDLVQATCLKVLAHAQSWEPGTRFDAWAFRIMRNQWIDTFRRSQIEGPLEPLDATEEVAGDGEARLLATVEFEQVRRAIEGLSPEQREVLLLVCVEDMTYADAASVIGIPVGTVMSRLARARRQLVHTTQETAAREVSP